MAVSTTHTVRVGDRDWQFRAKNADDVQTVRDLFAAIEAKCGLDDLIGHALETFVDKRLNGAKAIINFTERRYGGPGHLIRPTEEELAASTAFLRSYGLKDDTPEEIESRRLRREFYAEMAAAEEWERDRR